MGKRMGVALSGGGHRAALWASGAILGMSDAGAAADVVSVASVSGGSIANGLLAAAPSPLDQSTTGQIEAALGPGLRQWASSGLFFTGPATDAYAARVFKQAGVALAGLVAAVLGFLALGRGWSLVVAMAVAGVGVIVVLGLAGRLAAKLPKRYRGSLVMGAAASIVLSPLVLYDATQTQGLVLVVVTVGLLAVVAAVVLVVLTTFGRRSLVVEEALGAGLFGRPDGPIPIAELADRSVHHVFCSTNLVSGTHLYISPKLVYGAEVGAAPPAAGLLLATAVQASACLPGAFAPRAIPGSTLGEGLDDVVLTDGGVYDNMADQWEFGFSNRARAFQRLSLSLGDYQPLGAEELVVVNASKALSPQPFDGTGVGGEVTSLMRCKDVLYDQTTAVRRRYLVDTWNAGAAAKEGMTGVLVHIAQHPTTVPTAFASSPDHDQVGRAVEAQAFVQRLTALDGIDWEQVVAENASVPTTLGPIGVELAAQLVRHAYVLARINLAVVLGRGSLPSAEVPDETVLEAFGLARFRALFDEHEKQTATP